ncbi:MAG: HAD hydrolase-like protein [bacterium]|nr:HAD hydrolase-like protein [bacterium]
MQALFFDLDGTLTDPKPGITGCIQYALEGLGQPVPGKDELEWCIGPPLHESFARLVGSEEAWRGVALYRERYGEIGLFENEVYEGIPDVLAALAAQGGELFVASSKPKVYVDRILDHFDLTRFFVRTYGSELDGTNTDKRDLLAVALADSGIAPIDATMIGDRAHDAIGAAHNALDFVGALYGYGSREELEDEGTTRFVHEPTELVRALVLP